MSIILVVNDPKVRRVLEREKFFKKRNINFSILVYPHPKFLNFVPTLLKGMKKVKEENETVVISTMNNPIHLHFVGLALKILFRNKVRWFAEFRDGWVSNVQRVDKRSVKLWIHKLLEKLVVRWADCIGWVQGFIVDETYFKRTYAEYADKVFRLPYVGYDPMWFKVKSEKPREVFKVVYAGTFYDGWIEPVTFFYALAEFVKKENINQRSLIVEFYGDWRERYTEMVNDLKISEYVNVRPSVPYNEIIKILKSADLLLHIVGSKKENRNNLSLKFFDYIGARRPILVLGYPDYLACKLVEKYKLGIAARIDDVGEIARALRMFYYGEVDYHPPAKVFIMFSDSEFNKTLSKIYSKLLEGKR